MKKNRLIAFALSVSLLLGASACGKPAKTVSELIAEENAILDQHQELWTTALNSLDKDKLSPVSYTHLTPIHIATASRPHKPRRRIICFLLIPFSSFSV